MAVLDLDNFLHSLARHVVARAAAFTPAVSILYPFAATAADPSELWLHKVPEAFAAAALYSLLTPYGGSVVAPRPKPTVAVQCLTRGQSDVAASARAEAIFAALLADDGSPARMRTIDGYKLADNTADGTWLLVHVDPLQRPGQIGRDDRGRVEISFNVEIGLRKAS